MIVLDALHQLESRFADLAWLPYQLPVNIKLIVSFKRGEPAAEELLERMQGQAILAEVKPFKSLEDRRTLVRNYLSQYLKNLDEHHVDTLIQSKGAGNPLFLKVVLSEIRVFGAFANLGAKIQLDFGTNPVSAFDGVLNRLENDPAYSPIDPKQAVPLLFGLLAHARRGLSSDELVGLLVQVLEMEDNETSRQAAFDTINLYLRQMRPFLAHRDGRYDFFFESLKLAAQERYVGEAAPKRLVKDWHGLLAQYFTDQPIQLMIENKSVHNLHKLSDQAYHQARAGMGSELLKTLTDYWFMENKIGEFGTQLFIDDCSLALTPDFASIIPSEGAEAVRMILDTIRLASHILAVDQHQLAGQLHGRLQEIQNPLIQDLLAQAFAKHDKPWLRPLTNSLKTPGTAEEMTLQGGGGAQMLKLTSNGKRLVTGGVRTLNVWNLEQGTEEYAIPNGTVPFSITPDGNYLVYAQTNQTHAVWNLRKNCKERELGGHTYWGFKPVPAVPDQSSRVRVAAQGRNRGASASSDGCLKLLESAYGERRVHFPAPARSGRTCHAP